MIIELLVGAGLVAAGAAAARILVRRREANDDDDGPDKKKADKKKKADEKKADKKKADAKKKKKKPSKKPGKKEKIERTGPRGLLVGDVILYADTELWLAGCIELEEEGLVARLFPSPGSTRATWVAQLDEEADDLATLEETDEVPDGPVPESLPIDGRRLTLERRGAAEVSTRGEHLPRTTDRASYTLLSDAGGRVLIVVDFAKAPRIALIGDRVSKHMMDLLPGGDLDDED